MTTPTMATSPKPLIRALIADYTPDPPTITPTTDRDLIAKVIRQGGRRVWLDVNDPDSATLEWIAQTFGVSALLLASDAPFYQHEPFLAFGLPIAVSSANGWVFHTTLIAIRSTTLLTVSHSAAIWNDSFNRAAKSIPVWVEDFNETIFELLAVTVAAAEQAADKAVQGYEGIKSRLFDAKNAGDVSAALRDLLAWQSEALRLYNRLASAEHTLCSVRDHPAFQFDQDTIWKFLELADRWDAESVARTIDLADDLPGALAAQHTAQINTRLRGITIALFIALPILVATPWALVLPVQSEARLAVWAVLMIVAVGVSLALGIRAKLF